jgi:hypothetical protein
LIGPGNGRATFYHIFGDLVSTHMSPNAARVVRVAKMDQDFGVLYPHSSARFLAGDGEWKYASADEEDDAWLKWGNKNMWWGRILGPFVPFVTWILRMNLPRKSPIPGSKRFENMHKSWW